MIRSRHLAPVLALALLLPAPAAAQTNKDNRWTRDAAKFMGLAMTRQDRAERRGYYSQALEALREAFDREPDNAKVWFVAGQVHVGLGDYIAADTCFDRAITIDQSLNDDIEAEREAGWMEAFQDGVELMDQQQWDQALQVLEASEQLYDKRPEALLNIGSIYANRNDLAQAEDAFLKAAEAAEGPLRAQLDSTSQAAWVRYAEMSRMNVAQMRGSRGVDAFSDDDFDAAAEWFKKAIEFNPVSRDYLFNYVQARYAKASKLEEQIEASPADAATLTPQLVELYASIKDDVAKVREYDPTSEHLLLILVRAQRRHGELSGDTTGGRETALATLELIESMPVEIVELSIQPDEGSATVTGKVRNKKAAAGSPVTVKITLLGSKGESIGQMTLTVNVGEADSLTPFQQTGEITGQVAGWKYEVS